MDSVVYLDSMGHLWSPDRDTLHAFAASIGMKREWFQDRPRLYHYDLMAQSKRRLAIEAGAVRVSPRELVRLIQERAAPVLTEPERIQRRRIRGWRMPEGAVYVGRGSRWGNPFRYQAGPLVGGIRREFSPSEKVELYRSCVPVWMRDPDWLAPLRGKDLACWCPLDQPCHADVLLELANR